MVGFGLILLIVYIPATNGLNNENAAGSGIQYSWETWLDDRVPDREVEPAGFTLVRADRDPGKRATLYPDIELLSVSLNLTIVDKTSLLENGDQVETFGQGG